MAYDKQVHLLSEVDPETRFAVCAHCGPTTINKNTHSRGHGWRCATAQADRQREKLYGISGEQFREMLSRQSGLCAGGCGRKATQVDHCHATGKIRGLLCGKCNRAIGQAHDDPSVLERLAAYLREPPHEL